MKDEQADDSADPVKRGRGRPTAYRGEETDKLARKVARFGSSDVELAVFFEVSERTIHQWKTDYPSFVAALKEGKAYADSRVKQSLYRAAIGYEHPAVKIFGDPKTGESLTVEYIEKYAPNTTAMIFWLKNREPELWRDKQEVQHSGSLTTVPDSELDGRIAALEAVTRAETRVSSAAGRESSTDIAE